MTLVPEDEALLSALCEATAGEYNILAKLGEGGMAVVYLADDLALGRKVAIKVMLPPSLRGEGTAERFKREARTAASLSHPHIIPIHAVREKGNLLFFVMKYVEGRTLDAVIQPGRPLPPQMVRTVMSQVASALAHAHKKGIVHRDIKPSNVILDSEGYAVVMDFGIAKASHGDKLTKTGLAIGTPTYMSPEQAGGDNVTGQSDQYSLGVVAYEMLAGRPPFTQENTMALMWAHVNDPPPPLEEANPSCPPEIAAVVMRMLSKKEADRYPGMSDAASAFDNLQLSRDDTVQTQLIELAKAPAPTPLPPTRAIAAAKTTNIAPAGNRRVYAITAAVAAVAAAVAVYSIKSKSADQTTPPPQVSGQATDSQRPLVQSPPAAPANTTSKQATPPSAPPASNNNAPANAQAPASGALVRGDPDITRVLEDLRKANDLPAIGGAIVTSSGLVSSSVTGVRKKGNDIAATVDDRWHLGLNTQPITAVVIAALVERGKLKWESTIGEVFPAVAPEFPERFRSITVTQLLQNRAGLPVQVPWGQLTQPGVAVHELRMRALRRIAQMTTVPPGTQYLYSPASATIAGAMAERVTQTPFETLVRDIVFGPLGMKSCGFGGTGTPGEIDQPWPHDSLGTPTPRNGPTADASPVISPASSIHCSLADWGKFISEQLKGAQGKGALLNPQSYASLSAPPPQRGVMAMGAWYLQQKAFSRDRVLVHAGGNSWNLSAVWIAPANDAAFLVVTNQGGAKARTALESALSEIQRQHSKR